jgi:hypothetical protein
VPFADDPTQEFECIPVERHYYHPGWGGASFVNDIQLVKLQWMSSQKPARLNMDPSNVAPYTSVLAVGWGISESRCETRAP